MHTVTASKWGNSLAVRLPSKLVAKLKLKDGAKIKIRENEDGSLEIAKAMDREEALAYIRDNAVHAPPGFRFDREDANAR